MDERMAARYNALGLIEKYAVTSENAFFARAYSF